MTWPHLLSKISSADLTSIWNYLESSHHNFIRQNSVALAWPPIRFDSYDLLTILPFPFPFGTRMIFPRPCRFVPTPSGTGKPALRVVFPGNASKLPVFTDGVSVLIGRWLAITDTTPTNKIRSNAWGPYESVVLMRTNPTLDSISDSQKVFGEKAYSHSFLRPASAASVFLLNYDAAACRD